jgi:hypothetical protein
MLVIAFSATGDFEARVLNAGSVEQRYGLVLKLEPFLEPQREYVFFRPGTQLRSTVEAMLARILPYPQGWDQGSPFGLSRHRTTL